MHAHFWVTGTGTPQNSTEMPVKQDNVLKAYAGWSLRCPHVSPSPEDRLSTTVGRPKHGVYPRASLEGAWMGTSCQLPSCG